MYLDAPLVIALARIYPKQGRWNPTAGLLMMCVALALSSFSQNTTHLILTQGALYGIGGSIAYNPCLMYVDEWFDRRKGLACAYPSHYTDPVTGTDIVFFRRINVVGDWIGGLHHPAGA